MGSSKKHKDRDRDREKEHKRKRKHRSRSRSRSPLDRERSERKHRKREEKEKHRKRDDYYRDEGPPPSRESREPRIKEERDEDGPAASHSAAEAPEFQASLTIEEANKIRAKLGLKPLEVDGAKSEDAEEKTVLKDDIHVPAVNIAAVKKSQDLKEKLAAIREKRLINKKLGKVKRLGEESDDDDSVQSWVKKTRKVEKEKTMAERRAQMLAEMDEEFGISGLVEEEFGPVTKKQPQYSSKHLKGMKVEHSQESFKEGQQIILTLKDKGVLEEDADVLVNVNIVDDEKHKKNLDNKKLNPDYKPYDEGDDEFGMMKPKEMLEKYDEEIHGAKKEYFELGAGGHYDAEHERRMREYKAAVQAQGESLTLAPPKVASEFYTATEMSEKFKKVKKKVRKIRKKVAIKADDLLPLSRSSDFGSRNKRRPQQEMEEGEYGTGLGADEAIPGLDLVVGPDQLEDMETEDMEVEQTPEVEILGPEEDLSGVVIEEDQAGLDLELALKKARKLKMKPITANPEAKVLKTLEKIKEKEADAEEADMEQDKKAAIVLNATSEFCRALGEIPTYGMAGNRTEEKDELLDFEKELMEEQRRKMEEGDDDAHTGWQTVNIDTRPVDIKQLEDQTVLDDEPLANEGLAAVLSLASKKGYLEPDNKKTVSAPKHRHLLAQNYAIEDKRYDDLDAKFQKRDRYCGGAITDFRDKDNYRPEVRLEYVDEGGRFMSPKEAFRYLSHRFHGKGSGKKKQEKKMKKIEEEQLMKSMSSTDTPLGTVALLQDKQETEKTPFIVLSGGKAAHSLTK